MKTRALAAALVAAGIALTACSTPPADAPVDLTGQDAFAGPDSATSKAADDQAIAAAAAKVEEFTVVLARVESDPAVDVSALDSVSAGAILDLVKANVSLRRSQGIVSTGGITVARWTVSKVDAPQDGDGRPEPGAQPPSTSVSASTCPDTNRGVQTALACWVRITQCRSLGCLLSLTPVWPDPVGWRITADAVQQSGLPCDPI